MADDMEQEYEEMLRNAFLKYKGDYAIPREIIDALMEGADAIMRLRQRSNHAHSIIASEPMAWMVVGSDHWTTHWDLVRTAVNRYWDKYGNYFTPAGSNDPELDKFMESAEERGESALVQEALKRIEGLNKELDTWRQTAMHLWEYADHDRECGLFRKTNCTCGYEIQSHMYMKLQDKWREGL